ncbi:MAG: hypothetical protein H6607_07530 [Flavobacteriales bacterium]|nr:hypothetical protein [Flavobacteriales bacterium]
MTWINKIAFYRNIRNEVPNQELARELANTNNTTGIEEISNYLFDKNTSVASDCLKVLYEIGYIKPELIEAYADTFLQLLESKNNRMVWGSMIALATIAPQKADDLYKKIDLLLQTIKQGTLITEVWGIKTLVYVSLQNDAYKSRLLPVLFDYLEKCRPIDFATRVETILPAISTPNEKEIMDKIIALKTPELSESQSKKLNAALKKHNKQTK